MISVNKLKTFLLHESQRVRRLACSYLSDIECTDEDIYPSVIQSCKLYGINENLNFLRDASVFVMNEESMLSLLDLIKRENSVEANETLIYLFYHTPLPLFEKYRNQFLKILTKHDEVITFFNEKLALQTCNVQSVFDQFVEFAEVNEEKYAHEIDWKKVSLLIDFLAQHNYPDEQTLLNKLKFCEIDSLYLILLVQLIGRRKLKSATPFLTDLLVDEELDLLTEKVIDALISMQDPLAIQRTVEIYPQYSWGAKLAVCEMWGHIKTEESVTACIEAAKTEDDVVVRTFICVALCNLLSERGFDTARQIVIGGYDYSFDTIEFELIAVADILGVDLPERDDWINREDEFKERAREYQKEQNLGINEDLIKNYFIEKDEEDELWEDLDRVFPEEYTVQPKKKIGRNDPCPCGSGKKYKKCCMNKVQ